MTTNTPRTDEKKWCAYCGVWGDHQSGYCVRLLRDREAVSNQQLAASQAALDQMTEDAVKLKAEVEHIKALLKNVPAVHANTLRGNIATLSWDSYEHIIGPHPCRKRAEKSEAEVERLQDQLNRRTEAAIADLKSESEARQKAESEVERLTDALATSNQLWRQEDKILQRWKDFGLLWKEQRDRAVEIAEDLKKGGEMALQVIRESGRWAFEPHDDPRAEIKWGLEKLAALKSEITKPTKSENPPNLT